MAYSTKDDFSIYCSSYWGVGTANSLLQYSFNFQNRALGWYELTFSYVGKNNDLDPSSPGQILINFGGTSMFLANQLNNNTSYNVIGLIYPEVLSITESHFKASPQDNCPVVLLRPNQPNFTITVQDLNGVQFLDANAGDLAHYNLILHFKKIQD
jgi:hypothetical protein